MLPQNILSATPIESGFIGGRSLPVRDVVDYEVGGIAIQDPSKGLLYQYWRARILNNASDIVLDAEHVAPFTIISGNNITEVSLSFDRNMRPVIAYVENGTAKLNWYDTEQGRQTTTDYPGIVTPRVSHDDKRQLQSLVSDVIFAYIRDGGLYYRQQRDRFQVEIDPTEDMLEPNRAAIRAQIAASAGLVKIGLNRQLRMQFMLKASS